MPKIRVTKTGRRLIYVGIIAYLFFLVHALPASFLPRYILPSLKVAHVVNMQGVHGSIWQGQAADASIAGFSLGKLSWDVRTWGLLLGKLKLHLKYGQGNNRGNAYVSLGMGGSLSAEDVDMQFPAEQLMPLIYGFPISITGTMRGNLKEAVIERGKILQVQGRIVWLNAALRAPQIDLGDFLITLEPVNLGSKILVKDQGRGAVQAEITVFLNGDGQYRMNGWLKARDSGQQAVTEALRLFGNSDNSGRYWINVKNARLRGW